MHNVVVHTHSSSPLSSSTPHSAGLAPGPKFYDGSLSSSSTAFRPAAVKTGIPEPISFSKYCGINLDFVSACRQRANKKMKHSLDALPLPFICLVSLLLFDSKLRLRRFSKLLPKQPRRDCVPELLALVRELPL